MSEILAAGALEIAHESASASSPVALIDGDSVLDVASPQCRRAGELIAESPTPSVIVHRDSTPVAGISDAADMVIARAGESAPSRVAALWSEDPPAEAASIVDAVRRQPQAALSLVWLLRATPRLSVSDGLAAESATYSTLLAGHSFASWLGRRGAPRPSLEGPRVRLERDGDDLLVTLARPERRNALDAQMRDELLGALDVARRDPRARVDLRGDGPTFCAGGDLDEFGTADDVAVAHVVRTMNSVGRAIHTLRDRTTVHLQGASAGSGVELAAFAGSVRASREATLRLPELSMGLIPGAGGTVSITRRIGRQRTLWMALTGSAVGAETAFEWGLVDALE